MKTTKELLQILLDHVETLFKASICTGLCSATEELFDNDIISSEEYNDLQAYIQHNIPQNYRKYNWNDKGIWGWEPAALSPRLEWLKKNIELNN